MAPPKSDFKFSKNELVMVMFESPLDWIAAPFYSLFKAAVFLKVTLSSFASVSSNRKKLCCLAEWEVSW